MTQEEFLKLTETYGASPARWPDAVRSTALIFVESNPAATGLLAVAASVDHLLDAADPGSIVSDKARQAIEAIPSQTRQQRPQTWAFGTSLDFRFVLPRLTGITAMAVLGFYLGTTDLMVLPTDQTVPSTFDLTDLVFDTLSQENS